MTTDKLKGLFYTLARTGITLLLLWLVVRKLDMKTLGQLFGHMHWPWLAAASGVMLLSRALSCSRLIVLVRAKQLNFDPKTVARIVLASEFFGTFLPASIGGDMIRFYSLKKHTEDGAEAASAVWMERMAGVIALLSFACLGALWAWPRFEDHRILLAALIPSSVGIVIAIAALNESWVAAVAKWVGLHGHRFVGKVIEWQSTIRAYRHHPSAVAQALMISFGIHILRVTSIYCVARALGDHTGFVFFAVFVPLILLISLLPITIGGFGVRENAFVHCFAQVGMPAAVAFSASLVGQTLSTLAHVPGGVWSVWDIRAAKKIARVADTPA